MKLKLVEIFDLFRPRLFPFDDGLARRVAGNESFVNCIKDRPLKLMVEVHGCLALVVFCVTIDELLVRGPVEIFYLEVWNQLGKPRLREPVLSHGDLTDGPFFVDANPLRVVVTEKRFSIDTDWHFYPLSSCEVAHADEG